MFSTTIPTELIQKQELESLIERVRSSTGKTVHLQPVYIIETDDVNITMMMDALRDLLRGTPTEKPNGKHPANGHKHARKTKAVHKAHAGKMGPRSWKNADTGEIISARALKDKVAAGEIANQTCFENSKKETYIVIDRELVKEPSPEAVEK